MSQGARGPTKRPHARPEPGSILIAEDERTTAAALRDQVVGLGYEALGPAGDGEAAIELAKQSRPDLALLDIQMPLIGGLSAATVLFKHMDIPVVLVTGYSDEQYINAGKRIGVFGYLLKPVEDDELRATIAIAWSRYQERQQLREDVQEMKEAIEDRKQIERAKGLLMDRLSLGEAEAMRRLQKQARDSRRRLSEVARALIESEQLLSRGPTAPPQRARR